MMDLDELTRFLAEQYESSGLTYGAVPQAPYAKPVTVEELKGHLQAAVTLEQMTIPPYLVAMFSLKPGTNAWARRALRSVVMEEMLHMTLASNLLASLGGEPHTLGPMKDVVYPVRLPYCRSKAGIPLQHFSEDFLKLALFIEHPRSIPTKPPEAAGEDTTGWESIGEFYHTIRQALWEIDHSHAGSIFTGEASRQVGPEQYYNGGGGVITVTGLKEALEAVDVIAEQGEGAHDGIWNTNPDRFKEPAEVAHYFRFRELYKKKLYSEHDTLRDDPSGPDIEVDFSAVYPLNQGSTAAEYPEGSELARMDEEFNTLYAAVLLCIERAFVLDPSWMRDGVLMMSRLQEAALRIIRNPHPTKEGVHATPTFRVTQRSIDAAWRVLS